jgi:hypothetical protein
VRLRLIGVADIARAIASGQKPQFTAEDKQQLMNSALEARGINPATLQVAPAVEDPSLHLQEEPRVSFLSTRVLSRVAQQIQLPMQYEAFLKHVQERAAITLQTAPSPTPDAPSQYAAADLLQKLQNTLSGKCTLATWMRWAEISRSCQGDRDPWVLASDARL